MKHPKTRLDRRLVNSIKNKSQRKGTMTNRTIEFSISQGHLIDALTPQLATLGMLKDDEMITNIKLNTNDTNGDSIPISMSFEKYDTTKEVNSHS